MQACVTSFVDETWDGDCYFLTCIRHTESVKEALTKLSPQEVQTVLSLALTTYENLQKATHSVQYEEALEHEKSQQQKLFDTQQKVLAEKHAGMIQSLEHAHTKDLSNLRQQVLELQQLLTASAHAQQSVRENVLSLVNDTISPMKAAHEKHVEDIRSMLESSYREQIRRSDQQHDAVLNALKSEFSQKERTFHDTEEKLRKQLEKTLVSAERGKIGEEEFTQLAQEYTSWPPLQNLSKRAHCTDRSSIINKCETFFEIKNHASRDGVPSKEVEKFERDMKEHPDVPFGVFVALNADIQTKKDGHVFHLSWTEHHQLLLYISCFYKHSPSDMFSFIDICAEIALTVYKSAHEKPQDLERVAILEKQILKAQRVVEKEIPRINTFLITLNRDKKTLIDLLEKNHSNYASELTQVKQTFKILLEVLLGKNQDEETGLLEVETEQPMVDSLSMLNTATPKKGKSAVSKKKKNDE